MTDSAKFDLRKNIPALPQLQSIEVVEAQEGHVVYTFTPPAEMANYHNNVHGGMVYTMCEIGAGMVANTLGKDNVAITGSCNYIRKCQIGEPVTVEGTAQHNGRSTVVVRVVVRNSADKTVAETTFTLFVLQ